ncbi:MAG TPA: LexA family transcriptional regulator [Ferruginibacter sp.]|nr:LexA family transcriptional regulator [Ferruginibacter sp.]
MSGIDVKKIRLELGLSQQELADRLDIPKGRINAWEQRGTTPKLEDYKKLTKLINENKSFHSENTEGGWAGVAEESQQVSYLSERRRIKSQTNQHKNVPLFDTVATASNTSVDQSPVSNPVGTIDVGDLLADSEAAMRIYGNSMLPNYPPGSVVGIAQTFDNFILPGEIYVIETDEQRLLKRLFYKDDNPDSDTFLCYSDNTMVFDGGARHGKLAYPPFYLNRTSIRKLYIVTGVIKRNANSKIVNKNGH